MVAIISFMYRYLGVIGDEAARMNRARAARSADRGGRGAGGSLRWRAGVTGSMVGSLFLRSYERSERIYAAMQARGFDGELRYLAGPPLSRRALAGFRRRRSPPWSSSRRRPSSGGRGCDDRPRASPRARPRRTTAAPIHEHEHEHAHDDGTGAPPDAASSTTAGSTSSTCTSPTRTGSRRSTASTCASAAARRWRSWARTAPARAR